MTKAKDNFEIWELEDIKPHPSNAKKHSPEQVKTLAGLIKDRGWTSPIVVQKSTGYIIAGHGRRLAVIELGLARVPVIVKDVEDDEADALRLADNRVVSTDYDTTILQEELQRLSEMGMDLATLGFSDKEIEFNTLDLTALDETSLVDDIGLAVELQKQENENKSEEIDGAKTPTGEAFGFRKITVAQSRRIKSFMTQIESETSKRGADALMTFFDSMGVA